MTGDFDFDRWLTKEEQQSAAKEANRRAAAFVREEEHLLPAAVKLWYDILRYRAAAGKGGIPAVQSLQADAEALRAENASLREQLAAQKALAVQNAQKAAQLAEQLRTAQRSAADREHSHEKQLAALTDALAAAQEAARKAAGPEESLRMENERLRRENELHLQTIRKQGTQLRRMKLQNLQQKNEQESPTESEDAS